MAGLFIAGGVLGGLLGAPLSARLAQKRGLLRQMFAVLVLLVAAYVFYRSFAG